MCGIVGYTGKRKAIEIIVPGLHKLEYRGYDSAGVALVGTNGIDLHRAAGKIENLEKSFLTSPPDRNATTGIGHTRWATHGAPCVRNAHPHLSQNGHIAVVHNGIIENHVQLRARLESRGYVFKSDTDTEVIAHLIQEFWNGSLMDSVSEAVSMLSGTYGIAAVSSDEPDTVVTARKGSPIVLGDCKDECIAASDVSAIISHTNRVIFLDDGDIARLTPGSIEIRNPEKTMVTRPSTVVDWDPGKIEKGGYEHFMLKEIFEQPESLENAIRGRLIPEDGTAKLSGLQLGPSEIVRITNIVLTACGTSYYAGLAGAYAFEQISGIPAHIEQAAEFRYRNPIVAPDTMLAAISQSGETADTLAAVREAKRKGALVMSICNTVGSTIAREAGRGIYLHAGPEISVASTKAFTCQVAVLAMMSVLFGRSRRLSNADGTFLINAIASLPELARRTLEQNDAVKSIAERFAEARDFFYIGRGYMFPAAMEGALKLKEVSYIHAEGYHAAELKHGPIALLDKNVPVVACVPSIPGCGKTMANIQECKARGAPIIAIATHGDERIRSFTENVIEVPECPDFISAIPVAIAEQLLAYHIANIRGEPIDQPRNLAKSVTVE